MLKEEKAYLELKYKAETILGSGIKIEKMSNKDLTRDGDKQIPTKKGDDCLIRRVEDS